MAVLSEQSASGALETNSITFAFFPEGEQYASLERAEGIRKKPTATSTYREPVGLPGRNCARCIWNDKLWRSIGYEIQVLGCL